MSKKILKNRSQITATINPELHEKLRELSKETDVPISKLLDRCITMLLDDLNDDNKDK